MYLHVFPETWLGNEPLATHVAFLLSFPGVLLRDVFLEFKIARKFLWTELTAFTVRLQTKVLLTNVNLKLRAQFERRGALVANVRPTCKDIRWTPVRREKASRGGKRMKGVDSMA